MNYKKLMVISHNCFSKTGSNGRTLANYLSGWPKEKIAQMYIHPEQPDFDVCSQYYCLSDGAILKSILRKENPAGFVVRNQNNEKNEIEFIYKNKKVKNSIKLLMREFAWKSKLWNRSGFDSWINSFEPEIILVQAGDAAFLFDLAISIGRRFKAEIVIYNTEGYYFKEVSYLQENAVSTLFYPILNKKLKKAYERLVKVSKCEIYNCELLANDYKRVLHTKNKVIMNTSEFTKETISDTKSNQIIYAGNLGLNRHKSLIDFANAIQKIDSNFVIDVYGKTSDNNIKDEVEGCKGIKLHGFISYEELKEKLKKSKYLLHIESFDDYYREDLKYAFSTKIADSLAAGSCLFVYAPENMAVSQYLKNKNSTILITEPSMLEEEIRKVLSDDNLVKRISKNARQLAMKNHNIDINRAEFQKALLD